MSNGGSPNSRFQVKDAVTPTGEDCERVPMATRSASASPSPPPPPLGAQRDTGATTEEGEPDTCESSVAGGSPPPSYITSGGSNLPPPAPVSSSRVDNATCNPTIATVPSIELPDGKIFQPCYEADTKWPRSHLDMMVNCCHFLSVSCN